MTSFILITICVLLLLAYIFDISSSKTRIPSVILLLALGWAMRQLFGFLLIDLPNLDQILPIIGTVGLILIVLEGALELDINRQALPLMLKSFAIALIAMVGAAFALAYAYTSFTELPFKQSLANLIPFCVISSAIAIPSTRNFSSPNKEFIVYESSLSDILGVLFFNFITLNNTLNGNAFGKFGMDILLMILISLVSVLGLSYLLSRINHHIKFIPIIILVILVYTVAKEFHLPSLILILLFGLFLGNLGKLNRIKWFERFKPEKTAIEVQRFTQIVAESTFLIKSLFFLVFGFMIENTEILNVNSLVQALLISGSILIIRGLILIIFNLPLIPLFFVAPRGLITILLFLAIPGALATPMIDRSLVVQVILITSLFMWIGVISAPGKKETKAYRTEENSNHDQAEGQAL